MRRHVRISHDGIEREGMSIREVADALGVSRGTVLTDERSALEKIRRAIESKFGSGQQAREILFS